jgi:hypothetical protein
LIWIARGGQQTKKHPTVEGDVKDDWWLRFLQCLMSKIFRMTYHHRLPFNSKDGANYWKVCSRFFLQLMQFHRIVVAKFSILYDAIFFTRGKFLKGLQQNVSAFDANLYSSKKFVPYDS